jgi:hypothetical protein
VERPVERRAVGVLSARDHVVRLHLGAQRLVHRVGDRDRSPAVFGERIGQGFGSDPGERAALAVPRVRGDRRVADDDETRHHGLAVDDEAADPVLESGHRLDAGDRVGQSVLGPRLQRRERADRRLPGVLVAQRQQLAVAGGDPKVIENVRLSP